eukprot:761795-Hanusia_phi.AAC.3
MRCGACLSFAVMAALLGLSSPYNPSTHMLERRQLSWQQSSVCRSANRLVTKKHAPRALPALLSLRAIALGDGFAETASESSWTEISEGITKEQAEECSVMEAADLSSFFVGYMEFCNSQNQRLPRNAARMLQALLSHPAGAQGFWTTFLTDPGEVETMLMCRGGDDVDEDDGGYNDDRDNDDNQEKMTDMLI